MCTSRGRQGWAPTMHTCEQASLESELMASVVITFREMQLQCSSVLQKKKKKKAKQQVSVVSRAPFLIILPINLWTLRWRSF